MLPIKSTNISLNTCKLSSSFSLFEKEKDNKSLFSSSYTLRNISKKNEILSSLNSLSPQNISIQNLPRRIGARPTSKAIKSSFYSSNVSSFNNSSKNDKILESACNNDSNKIENYNSLNGNNYISEVLLNKNNFNNNKTVNKKKNDESLFSSSLSIASTADTHNSLLSFFPFSKSKNDIKEVLSMQNLNENETKLIVEEEEEEKETNMQLEYEENNEEEKKNIYMNKCEEVSNNNIYDNDNSINHSSSPSSVFSYNSSGGISSPSVTSCSSSTVYDEDEEMLKDVSTDDNDLLYNNSNEDDEEEEDKLINEQLNAINIINSVMHNVFIYNSSYSCSSSFDNNINGSVKEEEYINNNNNNMYTCYDEIYTLDRFKEKISYYVMEEESNYKSSIQEIMYNNEKIINYRHIIIDSIMRLSYAVIKIVKQPLRRCTIHLAISIIDRYFLSNILKMNNNNDNSNVFSVLINNIPERIAACVLHIAMKMEEPNGQYILYAFNNNINISKIILLEEKILKEIATFNTNNINNNYYNNINLPLSIDFAHFVLYKFGYNMHKNNNDIQLAAYLLDLFAYSPMCVHTLPSKIACAAVKLMRHIRQPYSSTKLLWPNYIRNLTGYNRADLKNVILEMNQILRNTEKYEGAMMLHKGGWAEMIWK